MADRAIQFRRGTTLQHDTFTGLSGEITVDIDKNVAVVHDGTTEGGFPLALESDQSATQTELSNHKNNTSNPHSVTKAQVGLGSVTNDAQLKIASNLIDLANAQSARANIDLALQADGGDIPETGRTNTWNARQHFSNGVRTISGNSTNHFSSVIAGNSNTYFFTVRDDSRNIVGRIFAKNLDGNGGGTIDFRQWDDVQVSGNSVHHQGNVTNRIRNLTASEVQQIEAIGSVTINNSQWGYVGNMDQSVSTSDNVNFNGVSSSTDMTQNGNTVIDSTDMLRIFDVDGTELTY